MESQLNIDTSSLGSWDNLKTPGKEGLSKGAKGGIAAAASGVYTTLNGLISGIKKGERIPDDLDPELYKQLTAAAAEDEALTQSIESSIASGLMAVNPLVGGIVMGASLAGKAVAGKDEYGVASSDLSAYAAGVLNPISQIGDQIADIKKDGIGLDNLAMFIPGVSGVMARKDALEAKGKAEIETANRKRDKARGDSADYFSELRSSQSTAQGLAQGGEVEGAGTGKSDSISTSLDKGAFVVPTENASMAKDLGKKFLGWGQGEKVDRGGSEEVKLSDGEVVFSPEESRKLAAMGVDLNRLAPNAEAGRNFKKGGKIEKEVVSSKEMSLFEKTKANLATSEGSRNRAYKDTLGHTTIGIGLLLKKADQPGKNPGETIKGERNNAGIEAIKSLGFNDDQITGIVEGRIKLTQDQINDSYDAYLNDTLFGDLKRKFGKSWKTMPQEAQLVMADIFYNQGANNMNKSHWEETVKLFKEGKTAEGVENIKTSPSLKNWRGQTGDRYKAYEAIGNGTQEYKRKNNDYDRSGDEEIHRQQKMYVASPEVNPPIVNIAKREKPLDFTSKYNEEKKSEEEFQKTLVQPQAATESTNVKAPNFTSKINAQEDLLGTPQQQQASNELLGFAHGGKVGAHKNSYASGGKVQKGYALGGEIGGSEDEFLQKITKSIIGTEGVRTKAYKDTKGHITIGVGLMLERSNGKRNAAAIEALKAAGLSNLDIDNVIKGEKELTDEEVNSSYNSYISKTLVPELERHFGDDWSTMDLGSKMIAADVMYNQGATNFRDEKWKNLDASLREGNYKPALDTLKTDPALNDWRDTTTGRVDSLEKSLNNTATEGSRSQTKENEAQKAEVGTVSNRKLDEAKEIIKEAAAIGLVPLNPDADTMSQLASINSQYEDGIRPDNVSDNDWANFNKLSKINIPTNEDDLLAQNAHSVPDEIEEVEEGQIQWKQSYDPYKDRNIPNTAQESTGVQESVLSLKEEIEVKKSEPEEEVIGRDLTPEEKELQKIEENNRQKQILEDDDFQSAVFEKASSASGFDLERQEENDTSVLEDPGNSDGIIGSVGKNIPSWMNVGNVASVAQIGAGLYGLKKQGERPVDEVSDEYMSFISGLRNAEPIGYTSIQYEAATTQVENSRLNELNAIKNLVGGDAGLAMASIQETGNRAMKAKTNIALEDGKLANQDRMSIRNQRSNAEFFLEKRRGKINNDAIAEYDANQAAYSNLLNAGVSNLIGNNDPLYKQYRDENKLKDGGEVKDSEPPKQRPTVRGTALVN